MCILSFIFQFLSDHKDAFEALKNLFEVVAIIVGGVWTYQIFILKRGKYPRAKLEQNILSWPPTEGKKAIRVILTIHNCGDILLKLTSGFTWVQQVKPLPQEFDEMLKTESDPVKENETEIRWPFLAERSYFKSAKMEIEPGENDEVISDFIVDSKLEKILVYSHIENEAKKIFYETENPNRNSAESAEKTSGGGIGWNISTLFDFSESNSKANN
jgi:hypothetical protein